MFFADLDRTIIFSKRFVDKEIEENAVVVEKKGDRTISYMKPYAYQLLKELRQKVPFVPVTSRTYEEIMRISFIQEKIPEWMICESGRAIYHYGQRWTVWEEKVKKELKNILIDTVFCQQMFRYLLEQKYQVPISEIKTNGEMMMAKTVDMTEREMEELKSYGFWFENRNYFLSIQSRKAYLIPFPASKGNAVKFLLQKLHPETTVSAGDADIDAGMFHTTTFNIVPAHHTISDLPSCVQVAKKTGIDAGEEILQFAKEKLL